MYYLSAYESVYTQVFLKVTFGDQGGGEVSNIRGKRLGRHLSSMR